MSALPMSTSHAEEKMTEELETATSASNTTIATPPSADPVRSAAAKVFNIPELLEMILISVAGKHKIVYYEEDPDHSDFNESYHTPVRQLFPLQRVNSLFKATIERSKLLQQRMFLAAYPAGSGPNGLDYWSPIAWMTNRLSKHYDVALANKPCYEVEFSLTCRGHTHEYKLRPTMSTARWLRPEASWRKMKVFCVQGHVLKELFCTIWDHHGDDFSWVPDQEDGTERPREGNDKSDETLGTLSDWLEDLADCGETHGFSSNLARLFAEDPDYFGWNLEYHLQH